MGVAINDLTTGDEIFVNERHVHAKAPRPVAIAGDARRCGLRRCVRSRTKDGAGVASFRYRRSDLFAETLSEVSAREYQEGQRSNLVRGSLPGSRVAAPVFPIRDVCRLSGRNAVSPPGSDAGDWALSRHAKRWSLMTSIASARPAAGRRVPPGWPVRAAAKSSIALLRPLSTTTPSRRFAMFC